MSENLKPPMPEDASSAVVSEQSLNSCLSTEALARRRMLLKSLGKGSAVVTAVSVPMHSLANTTALLTPNGLRCSVSGMQSSVHSKPTTGTICGGYSPGWWGQVAPGSNPRAPSRSWAPVIPTAICTGTFSKTGTDDPGVSFVSKTLFNVMDEAAFANTKTRHWIGAYLNGFYKAINNYPYTADEILGFYNLPSGDAKRIAAYTLITTYLETHSP